MYVLSNMVIFHCHISLAKGNPVLVGTKQNMSNKYLQPKHHRQPRERRAWRVSKTTLLYRFDFTKVWWALVVPLMMAVFGKILYIEPWCCEGVGHPNGDNQIVDSWWIDNSNRFLTPFYRDNANTNSIRFCSGRMAILSEYYLVGLSNWEALAPPVSVARRSSALPSKEHDSLATFSGSCFVSSTRQPKLLRKDESSLK